MNVHTFFAVIASAIAIISYIPYIRDIRAKKTRPHIFSWFVWTLMTAIYFFAQLSGGEGVGVLASGFTTVISIYIILASLRQAEKSIKPLDWVCFVISLLALLMWLITSTPVYSVALISFSDLMAFVPTFRKSFVDPYSETLATFLLSAVKHVLIVFSLESITFTTSFYTFYLIVINIVFVAMLIIRRRRVKRQI
jgi:hypothetical protein